VEIRTDQKTVLLGSQTQTDGLRIDVQPGRVVIVIEAKGSRTEMAMPPDEAANVGVSLIRAADRSIMLAASAQAQAARGVP
jgi:hypothetical protein